MEERRPKVGVGVVVFKDGKILLGKRLGSHASGVYAGPGGHVEFGESFEEAARREVREETGLEVKNIRVISLSNLCHWKNKQYADIGITAEWESGEPKNMEPEKCDGWDWYDINHLPEPLIETEAIYLEALKTGKFYFGTIR